MSSKYKHYEHQVKKFGWGKLLLGISTYFELCTFPASSLSHKVLPWWFFCQAPLLSRWQRQMLMTQPMGTARESYTASSKDNHISLWTLGQVCYFIREWVSVKTKRKSCKQKERAVHHSCGQRNVFLWLGAKTEQHYARGKVMLWQWVPEEEGAFSSDIFLWMTIFCNSGSGWVWCCKYSCWLLSLKKCLQQI